MGNLRHARRSFHNEHESSAKEERRNYSNSFLIEFFTARAYFSRFYFPSSHFPLCSGLKCKLAIYKTIYRFLFLSTVDVTKSLCKEKAGEESFDTTILTSFEGGTMIIVCRVGLRKEEEMWFECNVHVFLKAKRNRVPFGVLNYSFEDSSIEKTFPVHMLSSIVNNIAPVDGVSTTYCFCACTTNSLSCRARTPKLHFNCTFDMLHVINLPSSHAMQHKSPFQ